MYEAAEFLGMDERHFRYLLECDRLPRPTHRIEYRSRCYYVAADLDHLRQMLEEENNDARDSEPPRA